MPMHAVAFSFSRWSSRSPVTDAFVGKVYQRRSPAAGERKKSAIDKVAGKYDISFLLIMKSISFYLDNCLEGA